jgi:hypothetical protein
MPEEGKNMSSIKDNLKKVEAAMLDVNKKVAFGFLIKNAAIDALMNGIGSAQGKAYMSLFADNEEQLTRLTVPDQQSDLNYYRESRAYMVANAICGADSTTLTGTKVKDLDANLPTAADGKIKKPFPIP